MVDLFKDNHIHAWMQLCVCKLFSLKNFSETVDWIFTKIHRNVPPIKVKKSQLFQKNQACGALQALKCLKLLYGKDSVPLGDIKKRQYDGLLDRVDSFR